MKERHGTIQRVVFRTKRVLLQAHRGVVNLVSPPARLKPGQLDGEVVFESRTPLRSGSEPQEWRLTAGKIQNLRLAVRRLHGRTLEPGELFSFWGVVGRLSRRKGYALGREVRDGCIIPTVGGGICQLTNALYQGAVAVGCEIVERHPHTMAVPGTDAALGKDATVAWNDIDLRFRCDRPIGFDIFLEADDLVVRFRSTGMPVDPTPADRNLARLPVINGGSCVTCGERDCARHRPDLLAGSVRPATLVLDAAWPEWQSLAEEIGGRLIVPRANARSARYRWRDTADTVTAAALIRSLAARRYARAAAPEVRRRAMEWDAFVARALARKLHPEDDELAIAVSLLPGLWETGELAGRRYRVVLDRAPLALLHSLLDEAQAVEPTSPTLSDFRADLRWLRAEADALASSQGWITCHAGLARRLGPAVHLRDWILPTPSASPRAVQRVIAYPGPATARNGSRAVREVARRLDLKVALIGRMLESDEEWHGIERVNPDAWETFAMAVVQPSVIENRPTALLKAVANHVPILAGPMCGLGPDQFECVGFGEVDELEERLATLIRAANL